MSKLVEVRLTNGTKHLLSFPPETLIKDVIQHLIDNWNYVGAKHRLILKGKTLNQNSTLSEINFEEKDFLIFHFSSIKPDSKPLPISESNQYFSKIQHLKEMTGKTDTEVMNALSICNNDIERTVSLLLTGKLSLPSLRTTKEELFNLSFGIISSSRLSLNELKTEFVRRFPNLKDAVEKDPSKLFALVGVSIRPDLDFFISEEDKDRIKNLADLGGITFEEAERYYELADRDVNQACALILARF